jgi:hypothetical protein
VQLLKRRRLLHGSEGVGVGSTKAVVVQFGNGGLGSGPDKPISRLGRFFIFQI